MIYDHITYDIKINPSQKVSILDILLYCKDFWTRFIIISKYEFTIYTLYKRTQTDIQLLHTLKTGNT